MLDWPDAVLAAIPALVLSGVALSWVPPALQSTVGVGASLDAVPFTLLGLVAALTVVCLAVVDPPFDPGE